MKTSGHTHFKSSGPERRETDGGQKPPVAFSGLSLSRTFLDQTFPRNVHGVTTTSIFPSSLGARPSQAIVLREAENVTHQVSRSSPPRS